MLYQPRKIEAAVLKHELRAASRRSGSPQQGAWTVDSARALLRQRVQRTEWADLNVTTNSEGDVVLCLDPDVQPLRLRSGDFVRFDDFIVGEFQQSDFALAFIATGFGDVTADHLHSVLHRNRDNPTPRLKKPPRPV